MPANTSPDNIQFPTAGDQIAPLNTVFQNLAQTTQTALTRRIVANVADFTALVALSTTGKLAGDLAFVVEGAVYMSWTGTAWRQTTTATFATTGARDTAYAKASAAFRVVRVRALDTSTGIESAWNGTVWVLEFETSGVAVVANAGYVIAAQQTQRSGRTISVNYSVTKTTNWSAGTESFGTLAAAFRPNFNIVMGSGLDASRGQSRGTLVTSSGSLQFFNLPDIFAGANALIGNITYVLSV